MLRIAWKGIWKNRRNFFAFFISVILSISVLFLLMYLQEVSSDITNKGLFEDSVTSSMFETLNQIIPVILVISVAVLVFSLRFYVKSRIKDYGILLLLGIRKRDMQKILLLEYSLSCIFACGAGLLTGNFFSFLLGIGMKRAAGNELFMGVDMARVYKMTVIFCAAMIALAVLAVLFILSEKDISDLVNTNRIKEKRITSKYSLVFLIIGIVISVLSVLPVRILRDGTLLNFYLFILSCGVVITLMFGTGYLLEKYKNTKRYKQKIVVWHRFYHHLKSKSILLCIEIVTGILVLEITFSIATSAFPLVSGNYPNDFLCVYSSDNQKFYEDFQRKFNGKYVEFPVVWLGSLTTDPRVGMPLSEYNELFGKRDVLKKDEVISLCKSTSIPMISDEKERLTPNLQIGKEDKIGVFSKLTDGYTERYRVKYEEEKDLFGFQLDVGGVLVFSDELFAELRKKDGLYQSIALIKVKKEQLSEATKFVEERTDLEKSFCKETEMWNERQEGITGIAFFGIVIMFILFFSLFIVWLHLFSETEELKKKYEFLEIIGMRERECRKNLKGEIGLPVKIQVLITVLEGGYFCYGLLWMLKSWLPANESVYSEIIRNKVYEKELLAILLLYVVFEIVFLFFISWWTEKKVLKIKKE